MAAGQVTCSTNTNPILVAGVASGIVPGMMENMQALARNLVSQAMETILSLGDIGTIDVGNIDDIVLPPPPNVTTPWPDAPADVIIDDPTLPPISLDWHEDPYLSDLLDNFRATLTEDLASGGTGLGAQIEEDMWLREIERDVQALNDAKDRISVEWAGDGWTLPDGVLTAQFAEQELALTNKRYDKSRAIAEETRKIAIQQNQHTKEQINILEKTLMDYAGSKWERSLRAALGLMEAATAVYDAYIKRITALADVYKARAAVYTAKVEAIATIAKSQYDVYEAELRGAIAVAEVQMKEIQLQIEAAKATLDARIAAIVGAAQASSHLAAGALSALNVAASVSDNNSNSASNSVSSSNQSTNICSNSSSNSESTNYNHNYNESEE